MPGKRLLILAAVTLPLLRAHVVSLSTGELTVDGPTAAFELRMPMYELSHVTNPETTLLEHIRFGEGRLVKSTCGQNGDTYVCRAEYDFPAPIPDKLRVECTFFQVTVPNHIHLLTATQGKNTDQVVLDQLNSRSEVRFRPPSPAEVAWKNVMGGGWRALRSSAFLLFLVGIAAAARNLKEGAGLTAAFFAAEWLAPFIASSIPVTLSGRFLECAVTLALGYLMVETALHPGGVGTWFVVMAAGLLEGLSFAGFPRTYLAGANAVQLTGIAFAALLLLKLRPRWQREVGAVLLVVSLALFVWLLMR